MNSSHEDDEFDRLQSRISTREQRQQKERELKMKMELMAYELDELINQKKHEEKPTKNAVVAVIFLLLIMLATYAFIKFK